LIREKDLTTIHLETKNPVFAAVEFFKCIYFARGDSLNTFILWNQFGANLRFDDS
jgi:hypothetical protein